MANALKPKKTELPPLPIAAPPAGGKHISEAKPSSTGLALAIVSLALFVAGMLLGFSTLWGALIGAMAVGQGRLRDNRLVIRLGILGAGLNMVWFIVVLALLRG